MTDTNLLTQEGAEENPAQGNPSAPDENSAKPDNIPEKFWDAKNASIRVDMLMKSYLELEKKLGQMVDSKDPAKLRRIMGVPDKAEDYCIACDHGLFDASPDINAKLHDHGFTSEQAQLVYDLAAEKLVPMIVDVASEFAASREQERLVEAFGGTDKWREVSRQMLAWGRKHLPETVLNGLSASYEGVMALHKMMQTGEPSALKEPGKNTAIGEKDLQSMMRDPKYWRDKDPAFIARVTEGFKQVYAG